jgi:DNA adenine methylase
VRPPIPYFGGKMTIAERLTQGRAGLMRPTGWRHFQDPSGSTSGMPGYLHGYVDPPYVASTRSSGSYRHEMTDEDHRGLAEALHASRAAVVLSGYASDLYSDLYDTWHRVDIPTATGQGGAWQERTEVVWSNRPMAEPDLLSLLGEEVMA